MFGWLQSWFVPLDVTIRDDSLFPQSFTSTPINPPPTILHPFFIFIQHLVLRDDCWVLRSGQYFSTLLNIKSKIICEGWFKHKIKNKIPTSWQWRFFLLFFSLVFGAIWYERGMRHIQIHGDVGDRHHMMKYTSHLTFAKVESLTGVM